MSRERSVDPFATERSRRGTKRFRVVAPAEAVLIVNGVNAEDAEQQARKLLSSYSGMRYNTANPMSFRLAGWDSTLEVREVVVGNPNEES